MSTTDQNIPTSELPTVLPDLDSQMMKLIAEKKSAIAYQKRKHDEWNENYELYRGRTRTNRLTQRQSVTIPLMKETIKTALSRIDDPPDTTWSEKSGDETKKIMFQEMWNKMYRDTKLEAVDILDKKNVLIYGLSTKLLNLGDDYATISVLDPFDVLYDPIMNPLHIETARYIIHQNIYRSLREILADDRYSEEGKNALKSWAATDVGIAQSAQNQIEQVKRDARLRSMGVDSQYFARFAGGETIVNLSAHYTNEWNSDKKMFERKVIVQAQDHMELSNDLLIDCVGIEDWPFEYWTEDIETIDIYPDSVADLVRTPNKIINIWFSQLVENRTLRNFQMHWYDATVQGYQPQTYEPGQGRMLPAPGDPNKTIMPVDISGLDETMDAINFLTGIVERGSGVTAIDKGSKPEGQATLGEIQLLVGNAQERAVSMRTFYQMSWYATAVKWEKMMLANEWPTITLYKTGASGKVYSKKISSKDWKSEAGYEPKLSSTSEHEESTVKTIQKWLFIKSQFPNNQALAKIAQRRELDLVDVSPQEMQEIQDEEDRMAKAPPVVPGAPGGAPINPTNPMAPGIPGTPPQGPIPPGGPGGNPEDIAAIKALVGGGIQPAK